MSAPTGCGHSVAQAYVHPCAVRLPSGVRRLGLRRRDELRDLRAGKIGLARIPRVRGDADKLLGTVEERRYFCTSRLKHDLSDTIDPTTAYHIRRLLGSIDTIEVWLGRGIHQLFRFARGHRTAEIVNLNLHGIAVLRSEFP